MNNTSSAAVISGHHHDIMTFGRFNMTGYPSGYDTWQVILISVVVVVIMAVIIIGNLLVIVAIFSEYGLQCVQNWFVASLAVSDLMLGIVVMPFSLSQEVVGYWLFGGFWCQVHSATDVLLCTASILNITLISLDRYFSITRALEYLNFRSEVTVTVMICAVWLLSALVSMPLLVYTPWNFPFSPPKDNEIILTAKDRQYLDQFNTTQVLAHSRCTLSQDVGYVMYSAFGSFYIPSCIMVFVYIKIYYAARERARRVINKPGLAKRISRRVARSTRGSNAASAAANAAVQAANKKENCNISTISNNPNGGCINACSPTNVTTVGNSIEDANKTIEIEAEVNGKKPEKKTCRFKESTDSEQVQNNGENEAFLPKEGNSDKKRLNDVHILSASNMVQSEAGHPNTGRPSDPCEEVASVRDRPHPYGACVHNGGQPRVRRSIGVSTKDDNVQAKNSSNGAENDISKQKDNSSISSSNTSTSVSKSCLKFKLRSKLRGAVSNRRPSKETREVIDMGKMNNSSATATGNSNSQNNHPSNGNKKRSPLNGILKKMESKTTIMGEATSTVGNNNPSSLNGPSPASAAAAAITKLTPEQEAEKEKKRIARKKERRATLILGLIMGSFIACWFPFFFLYSISPVCPICVNSIEDPPCCVQEWGFNVAFWLGYSNSALNPVIYTVFNKDFRRAFKRILFK